METLWDLLHFYPFLWTSCNIAFKGTPLNFLFLIGKKKNPLVQKHYNDRTQNLPKGKVIRTKVAHQPIMRLGPTLEAKYTFK